MDIKIRHSIDSLPQTFSEKQFHDRIARGEIKPDAQFMFGDGSWRTVDNLPAFHRLSRRDYPPGVILREQLHASFVSECMSKASTRYINEYFSGNLIVDRFQLRPLAELTDRNGAKAAARLIYIPAFTPERVVSVIFENAHIVVESVTSPVKISIDRDTIESAQAKATKKNPVYVAFLNREKKVSRLRGGAGIDRREETVAFDPASIVRQTKTVSYPNELTCDAIVDLAQRALGFTDTQSRDGIVYRHELYIDGNTSSASWPNPNEREHPQAMRIIRFYKEVLQSLG